MVIKLDFLLKEIYLNYFNLKHTLKFSLDGEFIKFVYELRNIDDKNFNAKKYIKNYNNSISEKIINTLNNDVKDQFLTEKEFLHFTYPLEQTITRLQIIYITIGQKKWKQIFNFEYELFINLLGIIIFRINLFNIYYLEKEKKKKKEYEMAFPYSTNYFITKEELCNFFHNNDKSIDQILKTISIEIKNIKKIDDTSLLLKFQNKYVLYFVWDFLYNIYDVLENKVITYYKENDKIDNYYSNRGKTFEKYCFKILIDTFPKSNIFRGLNYKDNFGNHEIDILLETLDNIIIFECKSSKFDIKKTKNDKEMKNAFLKAFGNGFKTVNDFYKYINNNGNKLYSKQSKKNFSFDFKNKDIVFINLSLYNIEYLQTCVQKLDKNLLDPVDIYPINWNFIDFLTIMDLAKYNATPVFEYLHKRFEILNKNKNLKLDVDEIDAFGFLTDNNNDRVYKMLINDNHNIDTEFMINNGIYREQVNNFFNSKFIENFLKRTGETE